VFTSVRSIYLSLTILTLAGHCLHAEELKTEPGETLLSAPDAEHALADLAATFKENPCIKGRISTEVDDLLSGKRVDEGELLLDRSGRVLRKFTKPSAKVWLLEGTQLQEYVPRRKTLFVKDLVQAPKALKLLRAAATVDMKPLEAIFDIHVFRSEKDGKAEFRVVLSKKEDADIPMSYKRITARIADKALFFREISYLPDSGDHMVERYTEIQSVNKPKDEDFALDLPVDVKRQVDTIRDSK